MSDTAELQDDDHLGWELAQLEKLRRLADAYGWEEDSPQYKAKLKQVQALCKQRLADALGKGGGKEPKEKKTQYVWESCLEFSAKGWEEAKEKLEKVHSGHWDPDRRCPQTTSGGMVVRRFMCQDKSEGKTYLARLIDLQGNKWRLQRGNVEEFTPVEEERADDVDPGTSPDDDEEEDDDGGAA